MHVLSILLSFFLLPLQNWNANGLKYMIKDDNIRIIYGKNQNESPGAAWIIENTQYYFLPEAGNLLQWDKDNKKFIFEKYTIHYKESLSIERNKKNKKGSGNLLLPYLLVSKKGKNTYYLNNKKTRINKKIKKFIKTNDAWRLIYISKKRAALLKDNKIKIFDANTEEASTLVLPQNLQEDIEIAGFYWKGNLIKILVLQNRTSLFNFENGFKPITYIFRDYVKDAEIDSATHLDAFSGELFKQPVYSMKPLGFFPITKDSIYLAFQNGIYKLIKKKDYYIFSLVRATYVLFEQLFPISENEFLAQYTKDNNSRKFILNVNNDFKAQKFTKNFIFYAIYDSLGIYQIGDTLYFRNFNDKKNKDIEIKLGPQSQPVDFINGFLVSRKPEGIGMYRVITYPDPKSNKIQYTLDEIYHLNDREVKWIYQINGVPIFIKENWRVLRDNSNLLFSRPLTSVIAKAQGIQWIRQSDKYLLVVDNRDKGVLVNLGNGNRYNFKNFNVFGAWYRDKMFIVVSEEGIHFFN